MAAAFLAGTAVLASCDDDFTTPPVVMPPTVDIQPTVTLAEFKADYWSSLGTPAEVPYTTSGDTIIFTGRVCSSDETGNIYKSIVVQSVDADGEQIAINFSVNQYDLYELFPYGQEVAVYASGLSIGGYRNLLQFGAVSGNEMTFMDPAIFTEHVVRNHTPLPEPDKVMITEANIPQLIAAKSDNAQLLRWQSRLIRIDGVSWEDAGQQYAPSATTNRYIKDAEGNRINVRCSSYASFKNDTIPYGTGSVTGILSYYGSDWQILLNNTGDVAGFDNIKPDVPDVPATDQTGEGTVESPYNVAKALALTTALSENDKIENVYVKGTISAVKEISTSFGNATYSIVDSEGGTSLDVFRGYWLNGDKFTSENQLEAGAEVIVFGNLVNYKGNTPQFAQGNRVYSYNGQTGGDTPDTPTGEETELYTMLQPTAAEIDWTFDEGTLPEGLTYIWQWKEYNGAHYLNGSAYAAGSAHASLAYAVSPVLDLSGATGVTVSFEHAAKFQTTLRTLCGFAVREEGATEWTEIAIPTWPEAGSWTFASSGDIDLRKYDGKKVQIAFKYASTAEGADTWEIRNVVVKGKK